MWPHIWRVPGPRPARGRRKLPARPRAGLQRLPPSPDRPVTRSGSARRARDGRIPSCGPRLGSGRVTGRVTGLVTGRVTGCAAAGRRDVTDPVRVRPA